MIFEGSRWLTKDANHFCCQFKYLWRQYDITDTDTSDTGRWSEIKCRGPTNQTNHIQEGWVLRNFMAQWRWMGKQTRRSKGRWGEEREGIIQWVNKANSDLFQYTYSYVISPSFSVPLNEIVVPLSLNTPREDTLTRLNGKGIIKMQIAFFERIQNIRVWEFCGFRKEGLYSDIFFYQQGKVDQIL